MMVYSAQIRSAKEVGMVRQAMEKIRRESERERIYSVALVTDGGCITHTFTHDKSKTRTASSV